MAAEHHIDMKDDPDNVPLYAALAAGLQPATQAAPRADGLRQRLLERVRQSALAHREYLTVRTEDGSWLPQAPGACCKTLRRDSSVHVALHRLKVGAALPWPGNVEAQEVLLLSGALATASGAASPHGLPGALGYRIRSHGGEGEALVATAESVVYVRELLSARPPLPPLEAHWWALALAHTSTWVDPSRKRWHASGEGVQVLPLRGDGDVVSMLVRFEPGASVADHGHAVDEDCLVLQGDMFLGDILLRTGDYQLAPAGGSHFGETSEKGVLFFFHGALDPVLKG